MAAVDRFSYLLNNVFETIGHGRDAFALVGALYTTKKAISWTFKVLNACHDHMLSKISQWENLRTKYGQWAVVTGGSEGIGKAYARQLASRGIDIVLIGKRERRLYKAAKEIESDFGVQVLPVGVDFTEGASVFAHIQEILLDKEIGILVNNVGVMYDYPQLFLEVPKERLWQLINVNVATATMMTHMILPQMVERQKGAVVMISAGSCEKITPLTTIYSATKSFLDYFARAIQYEYKDYGITVQSLMPFYVATRMTRFSEALSKPSFFIPSADDYAKNAIATLGYTSRTTGYWAHTFQRWIIQQIPDRIWMWGATRLNFAFKRQASMRLKQRKSKLVHENSQDSDDFL